MKHDMALTNVSFNYLRNAPDFLNTIINNICSCVLLLNKNMELQAFNDSLKTIFSNKKDEDLLYIRCGEAIGCAYVVDEVTECGKTSHCKYCDLRISALKSYLNKEVVYKKKISRNFYTTGEKKVLKHLQFSTRPFYFEKEYYIILIIEDITDFVNQMEENKRLKKQLKELQK